MAVSVMFSMSGVNKQRFIDSVKADPQTYADWSGNGEWDYETTGKEDSCSRRSCANRSRRRSRPASFRRICTRSPAPGARVTDQGDLTYLNLVHVPEIDGTDPNDLTIGEIRGRREAIYALEALRKFMPGCEDAKLRNFGMTLGVRDTRKIDALYNLTGTDVREQARFDDAIGIFPGIHRWLRHPDPAHHRPVLARAVSGARAQGSWQSAGGRPLHRRRQRVARLGAQHDVLRRQRPGRRCRRRDLAAA